MTTVTSDHSLASAAVPPPRHPEAGHFPGHEVRPCSADCVLPDRQVGVPRQILRATAALVWAGCLFLLAACCAHRPAQVQRIVRWWCRGVLRALGIRLRTVLPDQSPTGQAPPVAPGSLVISNHISWLDPLVLYAVQPLRMVAMEEVARWPMIGRLATWTGTAFMPRGKASALREAVDVTAGTLREGVSVGVFPEGVTRCGRAGGLYHPALFQAALNAGAPVRPVVLRYHTPGSDPSTAAAYELPLLRSVRTILAQRNLTVDVHLLPEIPAGTASHRRQLARVTQLVTDAVRFRPGGATAAPGRPTAANA